MEKKEAGNPVTNWGSDGMCTCIKASVDIFPAPDVPGTLLVFCPRMGILTQVFQEGEDEAFEAIKDACGMVIDHNAGGHTACQHPWLGPGPQLITFRKK